ncbi:unnamed protein product [Ceratitis capitata]|uniref:(Mediterranean fruit fly) hypothetical protein n=1 Tax=Ceratitis capitata TaxID=7213 RepID=A0A811UM86_CERCA|nr:unnamed protein product [Ceratitis capitata]
MQHQIYSASLCCAWLRCTRSNLRQFGSNYWRCRLAADSRNGVDNKTKQQQNRGRSPPVSAMAKGGGPQTCNSTTTSSATCCWQLPNRVARYGRHAGTIGVCVALAAKSADWLRRTHQHQQPVFVGSSAVSPAPLPLVAPIGCIVEFVQRRCSGKKYFVARHFCCAFALRRLTHVAAELLQFSFISCTIDCSCNVWHSKAIAVEQEIRVYVFVLVFKCGECYYFFRCFDAVVCCLGRWRPQKLH